MSSSTRSYSAAHTGAHAAGRGETYQAGPEDAPSGGVRSTREDKTRMCFTYGKSIRPLARQRSVRVTHLACILNYRRALLAGSVW